MINVKLLLFHIWNTNNNIILCCHLAAVQRTEYEKKGAGAVRSKSTKKRP